MTPRGQKKKWLDEVALGCGTEAECLNFPFPLDPHGYGNFQDAQRRTKMAHVYICELSHGARPTPDHEAAHSCGRANCVNPHHLRWATPVENQADKLIHGTHNRGERQGRSILTEDEVLAIRGAISRGAKQRAIAVRFGVSEQMVSHIKTGRNWSWL